MAAGGLDFTQTSTLDQSDLVYTILKPKTGSVRCGSCNHPSTEAKCKLFCEPCDMFICKDCVWHVNVADDADEDDDDYVHETTVTIGMFANSLAGSKKKLLEEQILRCDNIKNIKMEYRDYLEQCVVNCQSDRDIFQKAINEVNYDLKILNDLGTEIRSRFDNLKDVYKHHDAMMLIKNRYKWKDFTAELSKIERTGSPRVCMSDDGGVVNQYPKVMLEDYCFFPGITGQDLSPKKVGRAWILHSGSLYLHTGGYRFWEVYYRSQIRPFVTLAEGRKDEVLVFLMQISGFVGQWSRNDIEMSGQPYSESITTDRYGSTFALGGKDESGIYIHRDSHVSKVMLPSNCPFHSDTPAALCVDPARELLCVYIQNHDDGPDKVYVYKIKYYFDSDSLTLRSTDTEPNDLEADALARKKNSVESHKYVQQAIICDKKDDEVNAYHYDKETDKTHKKEDGCALT